MGWVEFGFAGSSDWIEDAAVVVQPALIEDNPRQLLRAISAGVPVICTPECGLTGIPGVLTVEFGNPARLRELIYQVLPKPEAKAHARAESR